MDLPQLDLIHMVRNASLVVQMVLALLLFFSIASWAIILIKYRYIRRALRESGEFSDFFWKSRDFSSAFVKAKALPGSPLARIFRIAYLELKRPAKPGSRWTPVTRLPPPTRALPSARGLRPPTTSNARCAGRSTPK